MNSHSLRNLAVVLVLSAAVAAGHLIPGLDASEIEIGIRNALHVLVFAVFAAIVFKSIQHLCKRRAIAVTVLTVATVGGFSELLQYLTGNSPDIVDLARDLSGAALAICSRAMWKLSVAGRTSDWSRLSMRAGSALLAVIILAPLLYWAAVFGLSRSIFPTVLGFDNRWETYLYTAINSEITFPVVFNGRHAGAGSAAEIRLSGWGRSGLSIAPTTSDWTDYTHLTFIARMVKGPDTTVTVRINDRPRMHNFSDRFMASTTVTSRTALTRIPLDEMIVEPGQRDMDLSNIRQLVIFARDRRDGTVMHLDEIRLE